MNSDVLHLSLVINVWWSHYRHHHLSIGGRVIRCTSVLQRILTKIAVGNFWQKCYYHMQRILTTFSTYPAPDHWWPPSLCSDNDRIHCAQTSDPQLSTSLHWPRPETPRRWWSGSSPSWSCCCSGSSSSGWEMNQSSETARTHWETKMVDMYHILVFRWTLLTWMILLPELTVLRSDTWTQMKINNIML